MKIIQFMKKHNKILQIIVLAGEMTAVGIGTIYGITRYAETHREAIEYSIEKRLFKTDKVTVTDKYLAATSDGKGTGKCVTVKFNGQKYNLYDSKLYDRVKKGDRLKGYYHYDDSYEKTLYSADGKKAKQAE